MAKIKGLATQLKLASNTIANVVSLSGPSMEVGTVEVTDLSSTWRTYLPTVANGGEVSAEIHYELTNSTHDSLTDLITTPAVSSWSIVFADAYSSTYAFDGILTKFEPNGFEVDNVVMASIAIQITGAVTVTANSA